MENKNITNEESTKTVNKDQLTNLDANAIDESNEIAKPNTAILAGVAAIGLAGGAYVMYNNIENTEELNQIENTENVPVTLQAEQKENKIGNIEVPINNDQESLKLSDFEQAFADARANGLSEFSWQNNMYHTKTKEEFLAIKEEATHPIVNIQASEVSADTEAVNMTSEENENTESNITKVASQLVEKDSEKLDAAPLKSIRYGALDADNDGKIDSIAIDNNNDGKADAVAIDENSDGIYDVYMVDSDNDGTIDLSTRDQNQDGLDINDIREAVEYEMDMNDYIEINPNEDDTQDFDILTNLF